MENLENTLRSVLLAIEIYLRYIQKYENRWDISEKNIAQETVGILIIHAHNIKDLIKRKDKASQEDLESNKNCLMQINYFSNYIQEKLIHFI